MSPSFLDGFSCLREGFLNLIAGVQSVKQTGKIPKQFRPKNEPSCFLKSTSAAQHPAHEGRKARVRGHTLGTPAWFSSGS